MSPEIDVEWLLRITRKGGELALSYFGKTRGSTKADDSWVTEADLAVEAYLRGEINSKYSDDSILGEEGDDPHPRSGRIWAIDPIDGTRCFNHGLPVWGVSVGMLEEGVPVIGAFFLPVLDDLYHTDGIKTFLDGVPLPPPDPPKTRSCSSVNQYWAIKGSISLENFTVLDPQLHISAMLFGDPRWGRSARRTSGITRRVRPCFTSWGFPSASFPGRRSSLRRSMTAGASLNQP